MKTNTKTRNTLVTHEGGRAKRISPENQLKRSVLACMLWENTFYEDGVSIAQRIMDTADQCSKEFVASLAIAARNDFKLRHAPLLLLLNLVKRGGKDVSSTIYAVIQRPDEITELVSLYWSLGNKHMLPKQMKIGLARAFGKFDEYQLAKYNREADVKLRDVLFMVHAKPADKDREALYKRLADDELVKPDTWESRMAAGEDKKVVFEDLIKRGKLGALALLRNLRGMLQASVQEDLIRGALLEATFGRVLPYRFIAAAKHAPRFEPELDAAMQKCLTEMERLSGKTVLLVDVSGSMEWGKISGKSELSYLDAACGLGILTKGVADECEIYTFSNQVVEVPPRNGMALAEAINHSQPHGGTRLGDAVSLIDGNIVYDRLVVITDEQTADRVPDPKGRGYMINVAANRNGVGYGGWVHIDGFSEAAIAYIQEYEKEVN